MKKFLITLIIATLALGAAWIMGWRAERHTLTLLERAGFNTIQSAKTARKLGHVSFSNIALDKDHISTISSLNAKTDLNGSMTLAINGISLTGDTLEGPLSLSGMTLEDTSFNLAQLPLENAIINNAKIAILTQSLGGLSAMLSATLKQTPEGLALQSRILSEQKQLSIHAQATGIIQQDAWRIEGEIERAKIEHAPWQSRLMRAHGKFTASQTKGQPPQYFAQITAGGMNIAGTAWKNASVTMEQREGTQTILATSSSLTPPGLELSITRENNAITSASLFAPNMATLTQFFKENGKEAIIPYLYDIPKDAQEVTLELTPNAQAQMMLKISAKDMKGKEKTIPLNTIWP